MLKDGIYGNLFVAKSQAAFEDAEENANKFVEETVSVTSSTTFVEISELAYNFSSYEKFGFRYHIFFESGTTEDIKFTLRVPDGTRIKYVPSNSIIINSSGTIEANSTIGTSNNCSIVYGAPAATNYRLAEIVGVLEAGDAAGNLSIFFAQNSSGATATKVLQDSFIQIIR